MLICKQVFHFDQKRLFLTCWYEDHLICWYSTVVSIFPTLGNFLPADKADIQKVVSLFCRDVQQHADFINLSLFYQTSWNADLLVCWLADILIHTNCCFLFLNFDLLISSQQLGVSYDAQVQRSHCSGTFWFKIRWTCKWHRIVKDCLSQI